MNLSSAHLPEVVELIGELCNEQLDVAGCDRLEQLLLEDEQCLRFYIEYVDQHGLLQIRSPGVKKQSAGRFWGRTDGDGWEQTVAGQLPVGLTLDGLLAASELADSNTSPPPARANSPPPSHTIVVHVPGLTTSSWLSRAHVFAVLAATLLNLAFVAVIMLLLRPHERAPNADGRDSLMAEDRQRRSNARGQIHEFARVATLTVAENCRWDVSDPADGGRYQRALGKGSRLREGEQLGLVSGTAEIVFDDGANLVLEGPSRLEIDSAGSARLARGKLLAKVPARAVGFTIETESARMVDLGTEFGVECNSQGRTQLVVFRGEVEFTAIENHGGDRVLGKSQRVTAGRAIQARLAANGNPEVQAIPFDAKSIASVANLRPMMHSGGKPVVVPLTSGNLLIEPTIVAVNSEHPGGSSGRRAGANVVNGSGLKAGKSGILGATDSTHDSGQNTVWHQSTLDNGAETFISFNLGGLYDLQVTRIWNLNQVDELGNVTTQNGAKDIEILVSTDDFNYRPLTAIKLNEARGTPTEPAQDFATPASGIKYVKFVIPTGYGASGQGFKGLAEVRFEGRSVSGPDESK